MPQFDLIIASEVIYELELIEPLIQTFVSLCHEHTKILLCYTKWRYAVSQFWPEAEKVFSIEYVSDEEVKECMERVRVSEGRLKRGEDEEKSGSKEQKDQEQEQEEEEEEVVIGIAILRLKPKA